MEKLRAIAAEWWLTWVFGCVAAGLTYKVRQLKAKQVKAEKRQEAVEDGVQALLRAEIIRDYEKYHDQGYITMHGLEAVGKAYNAYSALGGNGTITELVEAMRDLEVRC